jgi:hypothetical protein
VLTYRLISGDRDHASRYPAILLTLLAGFGGFAVAFGTLDYDGVLWWLAGTFGALAVLYALADLAGFALLAVGRLARLEAASAQASRALREAASDLRVVAEKARGGGAAPGPVRTEGPMAAVIHEEDETPADRQRNFGPRTGKLRNRGGQGAGWPGRGGANPT